MTNADSVMTAPPKMGRRPAPRTHTYMHTRISSLKGSHSTSSHPFFSLFSFLSHPLKSPHAKLFPYMVQLFDKPSPSPLSLPSTLFLPASSLALPLKNHSDQPQLSPSFAVSPSMRRSASPLRPPLFLFLLLLNPPSSPPTSFHHRFFRRRYCLPHPLPFPFSL